MAKDATELLVGSNGSIYVGPLLTIEPTDIDDTLDPAFIELGYATPDGVRLVDSRAIEDIRAWQSFYVLRKVVTERDFTATFTLQQWNEETVPFAFGGGTVADQGGGAYKYTPPSPEELDERVLVVEWADGTKDYRLVVPKGLVVENVEVAVARTSEAQLPITFAATPTGTGDPWYLLTNDPAFAS